MTKINLNLLKEGETIKYLDVTVQCKGIKKRCHKVMPHCLDFGTFSEDTTLESIKDEAIGFVKSEMREITGKSIIIKAIKNGAKINRGFLSIMTSSQEIFNAERLEVIL